MVERGEVQASGPATQPSLPDQGPLTCGMLGLKSQDLLETRNDLHATVIYFYETGLDRGTAGLLAGQQVRVTEALDPSATEVLLEPVDYGDFERRWVPGGVRSHKSYQGFAIEATCGVIARYFRPVSVASLDDHS